MDLSLLDSVSPLAVFLCAIAAMALGMFWYSPAGFGKQWMKLVGLTEADCKDTNMGFAMLQGFVSNLIYATFLGWLLLALGIIELSHAIGLGVLIWVGLIFPAEWSGMIWEQRPFKLFLINGGYTLVFLVIAMAILASV